MRRLKKPALPALLLPLLLCGACGADAVGLPEPTPTPTPTSTPKAVGMIPGLYVHNAAIGNVGVDGSPELRPTAKSNFHIDQLEVNALRARVALSSFRVTWVDGVRGVLPAPQPKERLFGYLFPATVPDLRKPNKSVKQDVEIKLFLPANASGSTVPLIVRPATGPLAVQLTFGDQPSIDVSGLPPNTIDVQLTTAGKIGSRLIDVKNGCKKSTRRQKFVLRGIYNETQSFRFSFRDPNPLVCHGRMLIPHK